MPHKSGIFPHKLTCFFHRHALSVGRAATLGPAQCYASQCVSTRTTEAAGTAAPYNSRSTTPREPRQEATTPSSEASSSSVAQPGGAKQCPLDTNYWHYSRSWPWWQQRAFVVPAGIAFVVLANVLESPGLKTTLIASVPVALLWYLSLYLVPKNFTSYCNQWASTHPEEMKRLN